MEKFTQGMEMKDTEAGTTTPEKLSPEQALEIMGDEQYIGPEDIEKTFCFKPEPESVPEIPFSTDELKRAKELGQRLILYVDTTKAEVPLTVANMNILVGGKRSDDRDWLSLNDQNESTDSLLHEQTARPGWRLTTPEAVTGTPNKGYLKQIEVIINYLCDEVFKDQTIPDVYQTAIKEFEKKKDDIIGNIESDYEQEEVAEKLASLSINQLTRERSSEIIYRLMLTDKKFGTDPNEETWLWSNSLNHAKELVSVLHRPPEPLFFGGGFSIKSNGYAIGTCFSRGAS